MNRITEHFREPSELPYLQSGVRVRSLHLISNHPPLLSEGKAWDRLLLSAPVYRGP